MGITGYSIVESAITKRRQLTLIYHLHIKTLYQSTSIVSITGGFITGGRINLNTSLGVFGVGGSFSITVIVDSLSFDGDACTLVIVAIPNPLVPNALLFIDNL